jgi:hypothetical protein
MHVKHNLSENGIEHEAMKYEQEGEKHEFTTEEFEAAMNDIQEAAETVIKHRPGARTLRTLLKEAISRLKDMAGKKQHAAEGVETTEVETPVEPEQEYKQEDNDMKSILKALGLAEDATEEDAVKAIGKLLEHSEKVAKHADMEAKIVTLETENKTYADKVAEYEAKAKADSRALRVAHYTDLAKGWTAIAGKPDELAEELTALEEVNAGAAEKLVAHYTNLDTAAKAAHLTTPLGTAKEPEDEGDKPHPFNAKVKEFTEKGMKEPEAYRKAMESHPDLWADFRKSGK